MSRDSWPYKWGKRFYKNLDPPPGKMGFDGITPGSGAKEMERYEERHDDLARRIANNGAISFSPSSLYCPALPSNMLSWSDNPQCPPKMWDEIQLKENVFYISPHLRAFRSGKVLVKDKDKDCIWTRNLNVTTGNGWKINGSTSYLCMPRHEKRKAITAKSYRFKDVVYLDDYLSSKKASYPLILDSYWLYLIKKAYADFAYAVLRSSMFFAWYLLTRNNKVRGEEHFTPGMWDTFPLPRHDPQNPHKRPEDIIRDIKKAGQNLKNGKGTQKDLDNVIDSLFNLPCGVPSSPIFIEMRKKMLAEGFLDAFYGK